MTMNNEAKVLIGIPSRSEWGADFGMSLVCMVAQTANAAARGLPVDLVVHNVKGSILPQLRQKIAQKAVDCGATHLLFLDSDMTFGPDLLCRLLDRGADIVAANCATKMIPSSPTAREFDPCLPEGRLIFTDDQSTGVEEVWRIGTGVMLIKTEVLMALPKPWFPITWDEDRGDYVGEDWNFCKKAQEHGFKVLIDHDVSWDVGHTGSFMYTHEVVLGTNPHIQSPQIPI